MFSGRKEYGWLPVRGRKLTRKHVLEIYNSDELGVTLAKWYEVSSVLIHKIRNGKVWESVTMGSRIHSLDDYLLFGKYKGQRVEDVCVDDPQYIDWCIENIEGFELDEIADQFLQAAKRFN